MNQMSLFFIIILAALSSLNTNTKVYLVEMDDEHALVTENASENTKNRKQGETLESKSRPYVCHMHETIPEGGCKCSEQHEDHKLCHNPTVCEYGSCRDIDDSLIRFLKRSKPECKALETAPQYGCRCWEEGYDICYPPKHCEYGKCIE